jgi:hypothetical protein
MIWPCEFWKSNINKITVIHFYFNRCYEKYREDFYFLGRFHGSSLHGNRCTADCEAHKNFADESACLTADNFPNEVVTFHRSQGVLKMLSLYT